MTDYFLSAIRSLLDICQDLINITTNSSKIKKRSVPVHLHYFITQVYDNNIISINLNILAMKLICVNWSSDYVGDGHDVHLAGVVRKLFSWIILGNVSR